MCVPSPVWPLSSTTRSLFKPPPDSTAMASLSRARTLGGIGSILILLTVVPGIGFVLGLAGFLLVLLAVKQIAAEVPGKGIFRNMRYAVIVVIVAIVAAVTLFFLLLPQLFSLDPTRPPNAGPRPGRLHALSHWLTHVHFQASHKLKVFP